LTLCDPLCEEDATEEAALALPEGVPPLRSFYLYLTDSCNLRCRHCWITPTYVDGEPSPGQYLALDLLKEAVAAAKPLGLRRAKLTGGEPVLHPEFVEVVDYLTSEGLSLNMETNGTLIDEALAQHLKDETNLSFVSVSIDGPSPEVHDPFRGVGGSFEAAVAGFRALAAAGYRPQLIMCPHRGNVAYVEDVVEMAVGLGAWSVKFNPVTRSGRGIGMHERDETLSVEEVLELAHFVRGPLQARTPIELILSTPLAFYAVGELMDGRPRGMCRVLNILGILGSGEMALCGIGRTIPGLCFGNLGDVAVRDVWLNDPVLRQLRRDLDDTYPGLCGQCIHAGRCLTYCVAQNYQDTGRLVWPTSVCAQAGASSLFPAGRLRDGASTAGHES
jgi:SynChlorMet cassette radical SAM/SPASM protein ScmF